MKSRIFAVLTAVSLAIAPAHAQDAKDTAVAAATGVVASAVVDRVTAPNGQTINCQAIDIRGKNSDQIANIRAACSAMEATAPVEEPGLTPESVREWGGLTKEFGKAITETTKELGVQVNDFLTTPAGVLITVYLFWEKLGGILIGIPMLLFVWGFAIYFIRSLRRTAVEFEVKPILFGLINRKYATKYSTADVDNWAGWVVAVVFGTTVLTALTTGFVIF